MRKLVVFVIAAVLALSTTASAFAQQASTWDFGPGRDANQGTATRLDRIRGTARVILAGGLNAENVAVAIASLSPDVVDVSSGVESAPGIKDHERMRRFSSATRAAGSAVR